MKDLVLWRMLERTSAVDAEALPLLDELAERPLTARLPYLERLRKLAAHGVPALRAAALRAMAGASGHAVFRALVKGLHDEEPQPVQSALEGLITSSEHDPPRMVHAIFHREPALRARAIEGRLSSASQAMTVYLLPDSLHAERVLTDLPLSGLPAGALPAIFDMLAARSITPSVARDVLLRMRPADRFEQLRHGRAREPAILERLLEAALSASGLRELAPLGSSGDAFDDAIELFAGDPGAPPPKESLQFGEELIPWLAQSKEEPRRRVACSILRRWLVAGEIPQVLWRALLVSWPQLFGCSWLPAAERREAVLVFYELKDKIPRLSSVELRQVLDRAPPVRPSGNLDLRLLGALCHLLADAPLDEMIERYGARRIAAAFEENVAESAPFLALASKSPQARRHLVEAICADKRPRLPKVLAAILHHLSADLFDVLEVLTPYEVLPLLEELRRVTLTFPERRFSEQRQTRLAQELAIKLILDHSAYRTRGMTRGAAVVEVLNAWAQAPRTALDTLVREVVLDVARELPAETIAAHLLRLEPGALGFLLVEWRGANILPVGVERLLRESLTDHHDPSLRQWAEGTTVLPAPRRQQARLVRQLPKLEQARLIDCDAVRLAALLGSYHNQLLLGLAEALAWRRGEQVRSVTAAEALLVCDDPLQLVDQALVKFLPESPAALAELDEVLVERCQSQMEVGLAAHLWLYRWEEHLAECYLRLTGAGQTLAGFLNDAGRLQTPLLAEHCFRAVADLLAQWRYRDKRTLLEQATAELGQTLVATLPGPFGEFAARMLMSFVQVGVEPALLAELRAKIVPQLPDLTPTVRSTISDWISSTGLGATTRPAAIKRPPAADWIDQIRHSRILDQLTNWAAGDDLGIAEEAILRLIELGELGVSELASLLERPLLPPAARTIAATLSLWPGGAALARAGRLVASARLPPEIQFEACLSLVERGEREYLARSVEAVLADPGYTWFKPTHWERLESVGFATRDLALRLVVSPQPHAYITSVNRLLSEQNLDPTAIQALKQFLEQGDERAAELRVDAARRLHRLGDHIGFPILLAREMAHGPLFAELFVGVGTELAVEAVDAVLAAGARHGRESMLTPLLLHRLVEDAPREAGLRQLFLHGQNDAVRQQVLVQLRRTRARDAKLQRVAQAFAWGVRRARELTGRLFTVEMIGGDDLGFTRFEQPKVHINPLPILRGEPHGEDVVRALLLHEFGHHIYHADEVGRQTWKQAQDERLFRLLNLVSDEHLERNLRARDAAFGDPLKRLAAYAFQHARREIPVNDLLGALQGRALAVLTHAKLVAARKPGHVGIDSGSLLRELERAGHSFARFVRALRMGLGNRQGDPQVSQALELFRGGFRQRTMPELFGITRALQSIFGWQVKMLDVLCQDSLTSGDPSDATIESEGLSNDEIQREVKRILDPKRELRSRGRRGPGGELCINVSPDETFAEITTIERVPCEPEKHREYAALVRRPAMKMRQFFEQLGLSHVPERYRLQGRAFDRSRALALVLRGEPRVLIARHLVSKTDLFLGVAIDCSGSMQAGNNIEKARRFGALLAEAVAGCRGIDLRVFGFTDVVLYDAGDARRSSVHGLIAGGGNNDAAALWHLAQEAKRSRRRAKLLVMISDGLPTECSAAALRKLVQRLTLKDRMCCAQVAVRPIVEACFPNYIELNEADLDGSVGQFGRIIIELVRKMLRS